MKKILFICLGNIIRSQIAEAYYNFYSHSLCATSAGIYADTHSNNSHPYELTIAVMQEEGIDISDKSVTQLTKTLVADATQIYVLTEKENCPVYLLRAPHVAYWNVKDPYGTSIENFRKTRDIIKAHIKEII